MSLKRTRYVVNPTFRPRIVSEIRRRNLEPLHLSVPVEERPEVADLILRLSAVVQGGSRLPKKVSEQSEFLKRAGILIPDTEVPKVVNPECFISRNLLEFVPKIMRGEAARALQAGALEFNFENVLIQTGAARPQSLHPGIVPERDYPRGTSLIWVYDPGTRMWAAYRARAGTLDVIKRLHGKDLRASDLDRALAELLWCARILVDIDYAKKREAYWGAGLDEAAAHLHNERFAVLRGVLPPLEIAICRRYFRELESEGYLALSSKAHRSIHHCVRYTRHNDVMLQFLHRQSGRLMRKVSGAQILPSYSFLSAYLPNSALKRHTDRPQCAWNASVMIDQRPEVPVEDSWPIYLETPAKEIREVRLDFGDAVFYSGQDVPHWRHSIGPDRRQTLGLWHYVPIEFTGSLD